MSLRKSLRKSFELRMVLQYHLKEARIRRLIREAVQAARVTRA